MLLGLGDSADEASKRRAGTFELLPVVYHDFDPNRTILMGQVVQLLSRHLSVAVSYGGAGVLSVNLYFLINESNLPPAPPAPSPTATP